MAAKNKNLFLILAAACFIGIILIFVFDGYIGRHDTLSVTSGESTQKIDAQQWADQEKWGYPPQIGIVYDGKASFTYEIDNRRFSSYQTAFDVTVWRDQVKVSDVFSGDISIKAFGKEHISWTLDAAELVTGGITTEGKTFTVKIRTSDTERTVVIYVYSTSVPKLEAKF
jgi:hypothetical protein